MPFIAWHPFFKHPLPAGHRFPMLKYELLHDQLLYEGVVEKEDIFQPALLDIRYLEGVHCRKYWQRLVALELDRKEIRRIGFPLNPRLIERELYIAQGTISAAEYAFHTGIGLNIAGGTHHAGSNWGEGFCLLNDQAVAARYLLINHPVNRILIIDLDVHQGNGTAEIFENEKRVFTFSMHGQHNFPFKKEHSDWDIGLPDGTGGTDYLQMLSDALDILYKRVQPDFIFFQAGADVLQSDKMGRIKLTIEDCRQRDILVFDFCKKHELPVQVSMGGGYSGQIKDIINAHCNTFKEGIARLLRD